MGLQTAPPDEMSIGTNKPYPMLKALLGNVVWLIGGEGRPRHYSLRYVFVVNEIGACDDPPFQWYAQGAEGRIFWPPLPLERDQWLTGFLRRQANFSLGLRELWRPDVDHLCALCRAGDTLPRACSQKAPDLRGNR